MPDYKNAFGLKCVFSFHDGFSEEFSIVAHFSVHVVGQEGFSKVILIVGKWHSLEMKSHGCSTFEVSKFVVSGSGVTVFVEELGYWCSVLGEVCVTAVSFPFLIVIDNVIGLR